ncbi:flotillin [Nesterenkonia jeotgali]|uniref:Flotillin n=1 Tax=Nesterenkonia jeotgali TaxID=317018 RepID=A0A0W8IFF0_9MICC|nr:flotillin [Nesterenkonia jeotgali]
MVTGKSSRSDVPGSRPKQVIVNGRALVNPIRQRHEIISLRSRQVLMTVTAQSHDNVTINAEAVALVKIGSSVEDVKAASERFASQDNAVVEYTQDQLEGALRGLMAQQTVIQLMRDRQKFSDEISESISPELQTQGLLLDSFQIREITDDSGYISSLGAPEIEAKRQAAEIAATNAERAIAKERIANQEQNLIEETEYDSNQAAATSRVGQARAQAEQAEALAGEKARQEVLGQRAENRQAELDAEVKRVADAELYKQQKRADAEAYERTKAAEAEALVAESEARARLRRAEAEALRENQEAVLAREALAVLPQLMESFAAGYANIGSMTLIGGSGDSGASKHFDGESSVALAGVLKSVEAATGIDLGSILQAKVQGTAMGEAMAESNHTGTGVDQER